jgi:plasma kallikrein
MLMKKIPAAHCVQGKNPSALKVRAGEWDTQTKNELFPHTDHDVQDLIVHKDYYKGGLHNDIALLFLKDQVKFEQHVNTVCLPPQDAVFDQSRCFASGWGKDVFGKEGKYQVILKKIDLPVVPFLQCQESLRKTRLGKRFNLHNSFMCAGGEPGRGLFGQISVIDNI